MGGINAALTNNQMTQKHIKLIENRVSKVLTKYNEVIDNNRQLRMKIDEYRRERIIYDAIYKKLEHDLHNKKKEMENIIEDSKYSYMLRDKNHKQMSNFQQQLEKNKQQLELKIQEHEKVIRDLRITIEKKRLLQFEKLAQNNLMNLTNNSTSPTRLNTTSSLNSTIQDPSVSNPQGGDYQKRLIAQGLIKNSLWKNGQNNGQPMGSTGLTQEKINSYEETLLSIMKRQGNKNIQEFISTFLETEEKYFSNFNYVSDLNTEIERIESSINTMRNEVEKQKGQGKSTDSKKKKYFKELEEKIEKVEIEKQKAKEEYNKEVMNINELKNGIQSIFARITSTSSSSSSGANDGSSGPASAASSSSSASSSSASSSSANIDEIFGNQGVTESNIMQYLSVIEQKTTEILLSYAASQKGISVEQLLQNPVKIQIVENNALNSLSSSTPTAAAAAAAAAAANNLNASNTLTVNGQIISSILPSVKNDQYDNDFEERPLTRQEITSKTVTEYKKKGGVFAPNNE